jgi:hypothetical protein
MEPEKEKEFKVTDKRSTFRQETQEQEKTEASTETATQTAEQTEEKQEQIPPLPEANLLTLISLLYTNIPICLGIIPNPVTQKPHKDLQQAKLYIDLLNALKEKTKGNLTQEEEQAFENILYEVRMAYVEANK